MRKSILLLCLTLLAGCMVRATPGTYYAYGPGDPYPPTGYVHIYQDGICWSDGVYYHAPCPWPATSGYGYYWWWEGRTYYSPRPWHYRPGHPPPSSWRQPPRVRDHRVNPPPRYRPPPARPRVRDHRR